ncbi:hypothetical protein [Polymorphospora sp. NPDC050346]|uniref:hypothetical protein n=1 Tax=Polymorphospora sp. NPDC050346 TaxID=3155780 RepID=UPI0033EF45ED
MKRTRLTERLGAREQVAAGEVLVATAVDHPVRGTVRCPAAPLIGGSLTRLGRTVRYGTLTTTPQPSTTTVLATTYLDRHGAAWGIAAAVHPSDDELRQVVEEVLDRWSAVFRTRRLLTGATPPACAGVRRTLALVDRALTTSAGPVFMLNPPPEIGPLLDGTDPRDVRAVGDLTGVPAGSVVVVPAAGAHPDLPRSAAARGLTLVDATCPFVAAARAEADSRVAEGDRVVVAGRAGYAAYPGITAGLPVPPRLVESEADVAALALPESDPVSCVVQPGIAMSEVLPVVAALRGRVPTLRGSHPDDFCYEATDRSDLAHHLARHCDVVLICGEPDAEDTTLLHRWVAGAGGEPLVLDAVEAIRPQWLVPGAVIGLLPSTSARPSLARDVISALSGLGPLSVVRRLARSQADGDPPADPLTGDPRPSTAPARNPSGVPGEEAPRPRVPADRAAAPRQGRPAPGGSGRNPDAGSRPGTGATHERP